MRAFITGITGQDGSYLAELLLGKGYQVIGMKRRSATRNLHNIEGILSHKNFTLVDGDLTDQYNLLSLVTAYRPDEIYNLAAQSHVGISFKEPGHTFDVTAKGCINLLEVIRYLKSDSYSPRFYQASSSEMFGSMYSMLQCYDQYEVVQHFNYNTVKPYDLWTYNWCGKDDKEYIKERFKAEYDPKSPFFPQPFQDENTTFAPQSPYAIAKVAAHQSVALYRKAYGIHASCGILFNHESPRRGENFVTRKVTKYIGRLHRDLETKKLPLGNLDASRDWGHAKDYVVAMWKMLQQREPDDYVVSTGITHTVKELCEIAFAYVGEDYKNHISIDEKFMRPSEVPYLLGKCNKAKDVLGWTPKYTFKDLIEEMVEYDIKSSQLSRI